MIRIGIATRVSADGKFSRPEVEVNMRFVLASDHAGVSFREDIGRCLMDLGHQVQDLGPSGTESVDYPDYAERVGLAIQRGDADRGVLVCGTGLGMAIAANKVSGIRAVTVSDVFSAAMAVQHNDAQVLCLGARVLGLGLAREIAASFAGAAFEGGRHGRRVDKIMALEKVSRA